MKRKISVMFTVWLSCSHAISAENPAPSHVVSEDLLAQSEKDALDDLSDEATANDNDAQKEQEEAQKKAEEEKIKLKAIEAQREAAKKAEKDAKKREKELGKIDALREALPTTTEYTLDPGSVEAVIELDPNNYGFRQRNHRMILGLDFDLLFRGRGMLAYDFRFFEYWSFALKAGIDWSDLSVFSRFRDQLDKPAPKQFSVLSGLSAKWRLTEWYLRSAIFLEPSLMVGYMWQTLNTQDTSHWRIRPGLFGGIETVFNSGLALTTRVGFEVPFDFGEPNPIKEVAEPLLLFGLGLAI